MAKIPAVVAATRRARLLAHVSAGAEDRPGCYRMLDEKGKVLYVGKSIRIRTRLLSYFRASPADKAAELIRASAAISWEHVPNEFWALVRELRLIKRLRPPFNVEHARRPRYAFVKLTREPAPRLLPVTRVREDGATYFGPFPRPARLAETVRQLAHTLGLRDCAATTPIRFGDQLEIFGGGPSPRCLRADTGSCLAPCAGSCTATEYAERVFRARRFLEGRDASPVREARERMRRAADRMDFEYAALLRDRAERLAGLQETLVAFQGEVERLSFVYRVPGYRGDDRIYLLRRGLVVDRLRHPRSREERARAARRIEEVYARRGARPETIGGREAAEMLLVSRWFQRNPRETKRTMAPTKWLEKKRPVTRRAPSSAPSRTPPSSPAARRDATG